MPKSKQGKKQNLIIPLLRPYPMPKAAKTKKNIKKMHIYEFIFMAPKCLPKIRGPAIKHMCRDRDGDR